MSKKQDEEITRLKEKLVEEARRSSDMRHSLSVEVANLEARLREKERQAKADAAAKKERATLDQIEKGSVPIEALRSSILGDYSVTHSSKGSITTFQVILYSTDRIENALKEKILERPTTYQYAYPKVDFGSTWKVGDVVNAQKTPFGTFVYGGVAK